MNPPRRDVLIWEAFDPDKGEWYTIATMIEQDGRFIAVPLVMRDMELVVTYRLIAEQHGKTHRHEVRLMRYHAMKTVEVIEPPVYAQDG